MSDCRRHKRVGYYEVLDKQASRLLARCVVTRPTDIRSKVLRRNLPKLTKRDNWPALCSVRRPLHCAYLRNTSSAQTKQSLKVTPSFSSENYKCSPLRFFNDYAMERPVLPNEFDGPQYLQPTPSPHPFHIKCVKTSLGTQLHLGHGPSMVARVGITQKGANQNVNQEQSGVLLGTACVNTIIEITTRTLPFSPLHVAMQSWIHLQLDVPWSPGTAPKAMTAVSQHQNPQSATATKLCAIKKTLARLDWTRIGPKFTYEKPITWRCS